MSFRTRTLLVSLALSLLPLSAFALGVRARVLGRLAESWERRADEAALSVEGALEREAASVDRRLDELAAAVATDARLRRALLHGDDSERMYLLEYGSRAMRLTGLSVLQLQDEEGRIRSSGHFRAEHDRLDPLPEALAAVPRELSLARVRAPGGPRLALLRVRQVGLAGSRVWLVGGEMVDAGLLARLTPGPEATLRLRDPWDPARDEPAAGVTGRGPVAVGVAERRVPIPLVGGRPGEQAELVLTYSRAPLREARREFDRWLGAAMAGAVVVSLLLAAWLSARLSAPLADLARRTERLDLERLEAAFPTGREDEIGALARVLDRMTTRLRQSAARLREAERRATLGEIARQVNHDIRNGLTPIRNVFRHLVETAAREPAAVADILRERRGTIESGIGYLETLAAGYARLSPRLTPRPCDVGEAARAVAAADPVRVRLDLPAEIPAVRGEPLALRRILENLVGNALYVASERPAAVRLSARALDGRVRLEVADDGPGLEPRELERIFQDFYTTRPGGTGLGLTVVRRLVADLGGTVRAESRPGRGTRFIVELPVAEGG